MEIKFGLKLEILLDLLEHAPVGQHGVIVALAKELEEEYKTKIEPLLKEVNSEDSSI